MASGDGTLPGQREGPMSRFWAQRLAAYLALVLLFGACRATPAESTQPLETVELPPPDTTGERPLEAVVAGRRSVRTYTDETLSLAQVGQLLWAAQGVTDAAGHRTAPSAGALYPLELYVVLPDGLYHYLPAQHQLARLAEEELREVVWEAGLRQDALREAPAIFVFTAVYQRTADRYGDRAERYVHMEVGHAAQNLALQAVAMGLGSVPIGAMHDDQVQARLGLPADHVPLYLIPVGYPRE